MQPAKKGAGLMGHVAKQDYKEHQSSNGAGEHAHRKNHTQERETSTSQHS
jgi:hypothetical protein